MKNTSLKQHVSSLEIYAYITTNGFKQKLPLLYEWEYRVQNKNTPIKADNKANQ